MGIKIQDLGTKIRLFLMGRDSNTLRAENQEVLSDGGDAECKKSVVFRVMI